MCVWLSMCPGPAGHVPRPCAQDIGSGNCAVHNTWMLDHPQKSVLWGPWRYYPYAAPLPPPCVLHGFGTACMGVPRLCPHACQSWGKSHGIMVLQFRLL